jgi:hypothetical protein
MLHRSGPKLQCIFAAQQHTTMRILHLLGTMIPFGLSAQFTYYAVPPTDGCNGVWAVNAPAFYCGSAPYTYLTEPVGCISFSGWSNDQDTLFLPLCSYPCSLLIISSDGSECGGFTGATSIASTAAEPLRIRTTAEGIEVLNWSDLPAGTLSVLDMSGHVVSEVRLVPGQRPYLSAPAMAGAYVVNFQGGGLQLREPFVVVR